MNLIKVKVLQNFQVPDHGAFEEGTERALGYDLAVTLKQRGLVDFIDTDKMVEKLDRKTAVFAGVAGVSGKKSKQKLN